ncbi:MAG: hypothetical protein AAGC46_21620, partial [Solirubrobacteraceae bacterium]
SAPGPRPPPPDPPPPPPPAHRPPAADGGARSIFEGRTTALARTVTRRVQAMQLEAQGHASLLEDREDAMWLGIDRDLSRWEGPTVARQLAWIGSLFKPASAGTTYGQMQFDLTGGWASSAGRISSIIGYDATPLKVGRVMFTSAAGVNVPTAGYDGQVNAMDSARGYAATLVSDWVTATMTGAPASGTEPGQNVAIGNYGVELNVYGTTMMQTDADTSRTVTVSDLIVTGEDVLPFTGTGPVNYGIKASDAIPVILGRFQPQLRPRTITDTVVGIQQLAFTDPTTAGKMIEALNTYHGFSWGVWEDKAFDFTPFGGGESRTWRVRAADPGVVLDLDGLRVPDLYTGIVVRYQTTTGEQRSVGPTGTVSTYKDDTLQVTDPTHPLIVSGRPRVKIWDLGVVADQALAAAAGRNMLDQINQARRAGRITIWGDVYDQYGVKGDFTMVRGGDLIVVTDTGDPTPRRVVTAQGSMRNGSVVCTVDNSLQSIEAIVAHLQARATGR